MNIIFYKAEKRFEEIISDALANGAKKHGLNFRNVNGFNGVIQEADIAVTIGVAGKSKEIITAYRKAGKQAIYIDKGYIRLPAVTRIPGSKCEYYKISLGGFQPLKYLMLHNMPSDRWDQIRTRFNRQLEPIRSRGEYIIYSGPSAKNAKFHGLGDATEYAQELINKIRQISKRDIIYRPKQSWQNAVPVDGALYSKPKADIVKLYNDCFVYVVHNSNSSVEAAIRGLPVLSIGPSIVCPIAERKLINIDNPFVPTEALRQQWINNVCYWQWTLTEMADGLTWDFLKGYL